MAPYSDQQEDKRIQAQPGTPRCEAGGSLEAGGCRARRMLQAFTVVHKETHGQAVGRVLGLWLADGMRMRPPLFPRCAWRQLKARRQGVRTLQGFSPAAVTLRRLCTESHRHSTTAASCAQIRKTKRDVMRGSETPSPQFKGRRNELITKQMLARDCPRVSRVLLNEGRGTDICLCLRALLPWDKQLFHLAASQPGQHRKEPSATLSEKGKPERNRVT